MGYYSQVAYAIVCTSEEDKNKIIDKLGPELWNRIKDQVSPKGDPDRILFSETWTKWYENFPDVAAHTALLTAAEELYDEHYQSDGKEGVLSMGIFMRLGEDSDDFERRAWGQDELPEGYPEWHELVDERREIVVGWQ